MRRYLPRVMQNRANGAQGTDQQGANPAQNTATRTRPYPVSLAASLFCGGRGAQPASSPPSSNTPYNPHPLFTVSYQQQQPQPPLTSNLAQTPFLPSQPAAQNTAGSPRQQSSPAAPRQMTQTPYVSPFQRALNQMSRAASVGHNQNVTIPQLVKTGGGLTRDRRVEYPFTPPPPLAPPEEEITRAGKMIEIELMKELGIKPLRGNGGGSQSSSSGGRSQSSRSGGRNDSSNSLPVVEEYPLSEDDAFLN